MFFSILFDLSYYCYYLCFLLCHLLKYKQNKNVKIPKRQMLKHTLSLFPPSLSLFPLLSLSPPPLSLFPSSLSFSLSLSDHGVGTAPRAQSRACLSVRLSHSHCNQLVTHSRRARKSVCMSMCVCQGERERERERER